MKQIQKIAVLSTVCAIALAASFVSYTEIVTELVVRNLDALNSVQLISATNEAVSREEKPLHEAEEKAVTSVHYSASSVPIVPTSSEPDKSETTSILDKIFLKQEEKELQQWGISQWLTVSIPSVSVRAPVYLPSKEYWDSREWVMLEQQMQVGLLYGTTAYPHSVNPGGIGTIYIAGHSSPPNERASESAYGSVFARLPELKYGDKITIGHGADITRYKVIRTQIVSAADTEILAQQSGRSILKLITCYPVGTVRQRMIVTAETEE